MPLTKVEQQSVVHEHGANKVPHPTEQDITSLTRATLFSLAPLPTSQGGLQQV